MTTAFQKKGASILASVFIGLIILSFMFTGYQQGMGPTAPDSIGEVDGTSIRVTEYQRAYQQRLDFWEKMMGKRPSPQEIEQFGVKDQILNSLVEQKLLLNLAHSLHITPPESQVIQTIQQFPAFQKDGKFDVEQYKTVLRYNGMAPNEFENEMHDNNRMTILSTLLRSIPISNAYLKEREELQKKGLEVSAVAIKRESLKKQVPISADKVEDFLAKGENKAKLESYFQTQKNRFNRPAEVSAAHILLRITTERNEEQTLKAITEIRKDLTPANFAQVASLKTEDPSGKNSGGDLGKFTKGRMVEEFDKVAFSLPVGTISEPVKTPYGYHLIWVKSKSEAYEAKLVDHQQELAKEILQNEDKSGQKMVEAKLIAQINEDFQNGNSEGIKGLQQQYGFNYLSSFHLSPLDETIGTIQIQTANFDKLMQESVETPKLFSFDQSDEVIIVWSMQKNKMAKDEKEQDKKEMVGSEKAQVQNGFITALNQDLIKDLKEKAKIKLYKNLL